MGLWTSGGSSICLVSFKGNAVFGAVGKAGELRLLGAFLPKPAPQKHRGVPWAPSPLCFFPGLLDAVMCCRVFLEKMCCSDRVLPFKKSACSPICSLGGSLFLSLPLSSCPVRLNQAQVSTQDTVGFFFPLGVSMSSSFCVWGAAFSLKSGGALPRPAKIRLAFLRPARCAWLFLRSRSATVRSFLGFGVRLAGGSLFSSLSLSRLLLFLLFFFVVWCGHTFSNAPSPSGSTVGL